MRSTDAPEDVAMREAVHAALVEFAAGKQGAIAFCVGDRSWKVVVRQEDQDVVIRIRPKG